MARRTLPLLLVSMAIGCTVADQQAPSERHNPVAISSMAGNNAPANLSTAEFRIAKENPLTLVFANGDTVNTLADNIRAIDRLTDPLGRAWLLYSGETHPRGKNGIGLFIFSPADISLHKAFTKPWHMPGRLMETANGKCYYEAQVFAGEVLRDTIGVIWYERSLMPDGEWRLNTTLLNLNGLHPDTLVLFGHGRKSATMDLAFRGKCQLLGNLDQRLD